MIKAARRIQQLPIGICTRIENAIEKSRANGLEMINFGIGDSDAPTPEGILECLQHTIWDAALHQSSTSIGSAAFRTAVAAWYRYQYAVEIDPEREVVALMGSREGIANLSLAYLDPGDISLVPEPGQPSAKIGSMLAGAQPYIVPLSPETGYRIDVGAIPVAIARRARILWLNYPHYPTGAAADRVLFQEIVNFAREYDLLVCHDFSSGEPCGGGRPFPSILEADGAQEVCVELGSPVKPFYLNDWRLGWAAGNAEAIAMLKMNKSAVETKAFSQHQSAAILALRSSSEGMRDQARVYAKRRDLLIAGLHRLGWPVDSPYGTYSVWAGLPLGWSDSIEFAEALLTRCGIVVVPGEIYGKGGEGYVRLTLTVREERIREALRRIELSGILEAPAWKNKAGLALGGM